MQSRMLLRNFILSAIGIFLVYSLSKTILDYQKKINFYNEYRNEYQVEKDKNKELKSAAVKSRDYYTVERSIREKLNLSKPGEAIVIIPKITIIPSPTPTPEKPAHKQWLELLF